MSCRPEMQKRRSFKIKWSWKCKYLGPMKVKISDLGFIMNINRLSLLYATDSFMHAKLHTCCCPNACCLSNYAKEIDNFKNTCAVTVGFSSFTNGLMLLTVCASTHRTNPGEPPRVWAPGRTDRCCLFTTQGSLGWRDPLSPTSWRHTASKCELTNCETPKAEKGFVPDENLFMYLLKEASPCHNTGLYFSYQECFANKHFMVLLSQCGTCSASFNNYCLLLNIYCMLKYWNYNIPYWSNNSRQNSNVLVNKLCNGCCALNIVAKQRLHISPASYFLKRTNHRFHYKIRPIGLHTDCGLFLRNAGLWNNKLWTKRRSLSSWGVKENLS